MDQKKAKLEYLALLEEKARRKREAKDAYVPNAGQLPIHESNATIKLALSGNGCWAPGTKVRMFDGSTKAVEDVRVGDELMGPDSAPRRVLRLYQGEEELYEVRSKIGSPHIVNISHTMSFYDYKNDYREMKLSEWLKKSEQYKKRSKLWRPKEGIQYKAKKLPIDPYLLGSWLGDGSMSHIAITTEDHEVINYWRETLGPETRSHSKDASTSYHWSFHPIRKEFIKLKLLYRPDRNYGGLGYKFIPQQYKVASKKQRLRLLAGLIDTDGYVRQSGSGFTFTQKDNKLLDDVIEVCRSLGFQVSQKSPQENQHGKWCRVNVTGPLTKLPLKIKRKAQRLSDSKDYTKRRFIVEPKGVGRFYGFQVDQDNLLLLEDYVVQRNSGKTTAAVHEAVWAAKGYHPIKKKYTPVPADVAVVLDRPDKADTVWLPEMRKWFTIDQKQIHKRGKPNTTEISFSNGSKITFYSHEQEPLTFESIQIDCMVADEPLKRHIFIALRRGARKKGRKPWFLIIGTPLGAAWLRKEIYEPWVKGELPEAECFRVATDVNKDNINWEEQEAAFRFMSKREREIRREGYFFDLEGQALAHIWNRDIHVLPRDFGFDRSNPVVVAIDPHPEKSTIALMLGADRDNYLYVLREMAVKAPPRDIAKHLKEFMEGYRVLDIVVDSLGSADLTGGDGMKSFIQVLNEEGVRARPTTWEEKQDDAFIARIQNTLQIPETPNNFGQMLPKLRVHPACIGTISDIEQVEWFRDKKLDMNKPKLNIVNTDYLACLKYALATNLYFGKSKAKAYSMMKGAYGFNRRSDGAFTKHIKGLMNE